MIKDWPIRNITDFEKDGELVAVKNILLSIYTLNPLKFNTGEHSIIDTGMLAEYYCKKLFALKDHKVWNGPFDAETEDGLRIEIKIRDCFKNNKITCPPGMKVNKENMDWLFYVSLNENFTLKAILAFYKDDIDQLQNGRVSFKKAFKEHKYQIIYDEAL